MPELTPVRKKMRLVSAYLRGFPIWCSWQVTYACNYRCCICSYWKEEVNWSPQARAREASVEDIRLGASKLAQLGSLLISVAGGEPFLRNDLSDIVAAIAEQHFPLLTTNGSLVTEQRATDLWQAGLVGVSVSLDFDNAEGHDSNRGVRGAFERAKRAVTILSRTRKHSYQRVNVLCVLNERNLQEVESLIRFAATNDASFMIQPYTTMKNGVRDHVPQSKSSEHLLALKRRYRNFVSNPYSLARFDTFYEERGVTACKAGRAFFNVDNFLNVQKCVEFRSEAIGNLRELDMKHMVRMLRRENARNKCKACWYNCRGEIEALYSARGLLRSVPLLVRHALHG